MNAGRPATADVDAVGMVEVMWWPVEELRALRDRLRPRPDPGQLDESDLGTAHRLTG